MIRPALIIFFLLFVAVSPVLVFAQANPAFQYAAAERSMVMLEALRENVIEQALDQGGAISLSGDGVLAFLSEHLHPYAEIDFEYSDNIYLLKNNRNHDFINKINPGIKFVLGSENRRLLDGNYLKLDVGGNISNYFINKKADRSLPYGKLDASIGKNNHRLNLVQDYEIKSVPTSTITAGKPGTTDYLYNSTDLIWESKLNRFGFDMRYYREDHVFIGDFRLSSTYAQQTGSFAFFVTPDLMPKTRFLFEYQYDIIDYPKAANDFNDYYKNKYWAGIKGKITGKLTGTAKIGYETVRYRTGKEYRTIPVYGDLYYRYSRRNLFYFYASRELGTSSYISEGNGEYLTLALNNRFQINAKMNLNTGFWWSKTKYGGGDELFDYTYPIKLEYNFRRWLTGIMEYKYEFVKSDNDLFKYSNNIFAVGLKAEF